MSAMCPACGSNNSGVVVSAPKDREYFVSRNEATAILVCADCRSAFQDPWPDATEVSTFYSGDYQNYTQTTAPFVGRIFAAQQRAAGKAFVRRFGLDANILDFGCGHGAFLKTLRTLGCRNLTGFDFFPYQGAESPVFDFVCDLEVLFGSEKTYNVVRMNHVIEHLSDLEGTMVGLSKLLSPEGRLIGQTPDPGHYTFSLMKSYWGALHYPYHTVLFTPEGLSHAAKRWGLKLVGTSGSMMPTGWAMSFENILKEATRSKRRGRTMPYALLLAGSAPMVLIDLLVLPQQTAVYNFIMERTD